MTRILRGGSAKERGNEIVEAQMSNKPFLLSFAACVARADSRDKTTKHDRKVRCLVFTSRQESAVERPVSLQKG